LIFKVVFPTLSNDVSDLKRKTPKINILLVNTKVPKNTKLMVQKVTNRFKENPSETKEIIDEIDQLAKSSLELLTGRDNINLDSTSFKKWGQIIDRNHYLLGNGLEVSHPKLETVCKLASKYGLHAKLTGAGGGGFAFIILPSDLPTNIIDGIKEELVNIDCDVRETTLGASGGVEINLL
jgi:mevalonate kinase